MDGEWITAARAYEIVSGAIPLRASSAICSRANDGLVRARAKRLICGKQSASDAALPTSFWWARGDAALEQNWTSGDFETWIEGRLHCRAYGVEFCAADILDMVPARQKNLGELNRSEPGNYAPALLCRQELQSAVGCNEKEAEAIILNACRLGLVTSRCASIAWRVKDRYGLNHYEDLNVEVPDWFWENCSHGSDTILIWLTGRFAGKGFVDDEEYRAVLNGVEFQVSDIVSLERANRSRDLPTAEDLAIADTGSAEAGQGRRKSDLWRPWIAELVARVHDEGLPEGVGSQGQEELIKAVADALAERGQDSLSRSAVQPIVQAVLDRMRRANN